MAAQTEIHGEALARRLEKGGVRSLESEAFALRDSQRIKKGKRRLRQRQLAEFQYDEGRGPFEKPKWMLLLGKLYPSGKVTVHAVVPKQKGIVRRILAQLGAERERRKTGI